MADPPNPGNGNFFNIYIHHDDKDDFPNGWAQGIGTDKFKNPFYTMPGANGMYSRSIYHEGFHIFQYTGSRDPENPGFAYKGDTMWYVESSANWYMAQWYKGEKAYITAGTIVANPHLALWHGKDNMSPLDPVVPGHYNASEWMYGVRRYGMHTLLSFLTDVKGVDKPTIVDGYYAKTNQSPQEYLYRNIGPDTFRSHFADWAAHNTAGLETYLTKEQVDRAYLEISLAGDWNYYRPAVWYAENTGTDGEWVQPEEEFIARGWAYNVFNITNSLATTYTFQLKGESKGSQGAPAHFLGQVVVVNNTGPKYLEMDMLTPLYGEVSVPVTPEDSKIYLVVVSVPEFFGSYQNYPYQVKITEGDYDGTTPLTTVSTASPCQDNWKTKNCKKNKRRGKCNKNFKVKTNCKKTCNLC